MNDRYTGRPFLERVDSYILDAIGHLSPEADAALGTDWRSGVEREMRFPAGFAGAVREVWDKGRVKFLAAQGHEPDPVQFTRSFVDSKFPH